MTSYRLAFEGGGANFVSYLPIISGIGTAIKEDGFDVDFVAGSSAGSMAAFLLGLDVEHSKILELFEGATGEQLFQQLMGSRSILGSATRLWQGRPVYEVKALETLLVKILQISGQENMMETIQLTRRVGVLLADIENQKPEFILLNGRSVSEAIKIVVSSCSIPFFLKTHNQDLPQYADGGIFNNLPVKWLLEDGHDKLYALCFHFGGLTDTVQREPWSEKKPTVSEYSRAIVSTMIAAGTSSAFDAVPSANYHKIKAHYGTLDFARARSAGKSDTDRYNLICRDCRSFLLKTKERNDAIKEGRQRRSSSEIPYDLEGYKSKMTDFVRRKMKPVVKSGFTHVQMNSLFSPGHPLYNAYDFYHSEYNYLVPEDGIQCLHLGVSEYDTGEELNTLQQFEVFDEKGQSLEAFTFPMHDISKNAPGEDIRYIGLVLVDPISKDESKAIKVVTKEWIRGGFSGIDDGNQDFLEYSPEHGVTYSELTLAISLPKNLNGTHLVEIATVSYDEVSADLDFVTGVRCEGLAKQLDINELQMSTWEFKANEEIAEGEAFTVLLKKVC